MWSTSQVLHIPESLLLACIAHDIREIDFCNRLASILGWVGHRILDGVRQLAEALEHALRFGFRVQYLGLRV